MRRVVSIIALLLSSMLSTKAFAEPLKKLDLAAYYRAALDYSTQIKISEEEINRAKALYFQALSAVLPRANLIFTDLLQDTSGNQNQNNDNNVSSTLTRFSRPDLALNLQQTLFQGFKDIQGIKNAKIDQARLRLLKRNAERLLFLDVAIAYYAAMRTEREIESYHQILNLARNQLKELKSRIELGKNRDSESMAQQAQIALLEAEVEDRRGQLKVFYETLRFLTGIPPEQYRVRYEYLSQIKLDKKEFYVEKSSERWDIKASEKVIDIAKGEVKIQKGDLMPRVDINSNIYGYRTGFQKDIHWDMLLGINIPVFNGETYGRIREAKSNVKIAELRTEEDKRVAADEVRKSYENFVSARRRFEKYQEATQKAEQSYRLQVQDFNSGLINNLELLQSQDTLQNALQQRNAIEVGSWLFWAQLRTQAGILP